MLGGLKKLIFEDAQETPKAAPKAEAKPTKFDGPPPSAAERYYGPTTATVLPGAVDDGEFYPRLARQTAFETTQAGTVVSKYVTAMATLPLDANLKFKTAVAQAKALDGLQDGDVLAAFEQMAGAMNAETQTFQKMSEQYAAENVAAPTTRIGELSSQITALQQEVATLSANVAEAQGNLSRLQSGFAMAAQRRTSEIEQERARTTAILKG